MSELGRSRRFAPSELRPLIPLKQRNSGHRRTSRKCQMYGPAARYKMDFQDRRT